MEENNEKIIKIPTKLKPFMIILLVGIFIFLSYIVLDFFLLNKLVFVKTFGQLYEFEEEDIEKLNKFEEFDWGSSTSNPEPLFLQGQYIFRKLIGINYDKLFLDSSIKDVEYFPEEVIPTNIFSQLGHRNEIIKNIRNYFAIKALYYFHKAISLNPLDCKYHLNYAECLSYIVESNRQNEMMNPVIKDVITRHFEHAVNLNNQWYHPSRAYGSWLFRYAKSEEVCDNPKLFDEVLNLGVQMYKEAIYRNNQLFSEAVNKYDDFTGNYNDLVSILPKNPNVFYTFSKYLQSKNIWDINEDNFYESIHLYTERFPLYKALIENLIGKKRYSESIYLLKEYLEYMPDDENAQKWLADLLFNNADRKEEGLEIMEKLVQMVPYKIEYLTRYSTMLFSTQDFGRAIEILNRALKLNRRDHGSYFLLGLALEKQLMFSDAINAYENALNLNPKNENYKRHLARLNIKLKTGGVSDVLK